VTLHVNDAMQIEFRNAGARWDAHLAICPPCKRANERRPGPALFCDEGQALHRQKRRAERLLEALKPS
jgi:hypothetical protein